MVLIIDSANSSPLPSKSFLSFAQALTFYVIASTWNFVNDGQVGQEQYDLSDFIAYSCPTSQFKISPLPNENMFCTFLTVLDHSCLSPTR
jgi:hypothetical protein